MMCLGESSNDTAFKLISDEAIDEENKDRFGHRIFVDWLISTLESSDDPINIGIFGRWGTGKTGILKVFENKLESRRMKKYEYCYIDCWRISPDHIRQQFLIEVNKKFCGMDPKVLLSRLYHIVEKRNSADEIRGLGKRIKELAKSAAVPSIFAGIILGIIVSFDLAYPGNNILSIAGSTPLLPFITQLAINLSKANDRIIQTVTKVIPPINSHTEFEDIFKEIIAEYFDKKLVIALDNLDRCDGDVAIEILSLVKSFMEKPCVFFVIPCDTTAIAKHLKDKRKFDDDEVAEDFLRKFFQVTVTIPPLISSLMINYVDKLVEDYNIPNVDEDVKFVIVIASMDNPRRIKRFLNNYVANYQLAARIEKEYLQDEVITSERGFLTKILVLQDKFPDFYRELVDEENLLEYVDNYLDGKDIPDHTTKEIGKLIKTNELKEFLKLTQDIKVDNIKPFIRLAQDPHEKSPKYNEIRHKMRTNDHKGVNEIIESDRDNVDEFLEIIESTVDEDFKRRRLRFGINDLNVILHAHEAAPDSHKNKFIELFGKHAISENILDNAIFDLEIVFKFIDKMQRVKSRNVILEKYCRIFFKPNNYDDILLGLLINRSHFFTDTARDLFREYMPKFYESQETRAISAINKHFKSEHVEELLDNRIIRMLLNQMTENISIYDKDRIDAYLKIKQLSDWQFKYEFLDRLFKIILREPNSPQLIDKMNFVLAVLEKLDYDDVTEMGIRLIHDMLTIYEVKLPNEDQKSRMLKPILKHFDKLSGDMKTKFINDKLQNCFSLSDNSLTIIFSAMNSSRELFLNHDKIFEAMFNVVSSNANPIVFEYLIRNTVGSQRKNVLDLISSHIKNQDETMRKQTCNSIRRTYKSLDEIDRFVPSIINALNNPNYYDRAEMLNLLTTIFIKCSLTQDGIIREFAKWTKDSTYGANTINHLNALWPHLDDSQKSLAYSKVVTSINNYFGDNTELVLDFLLDPKKITKDNYQSVVKVLMNRIDSDGEIVLESMYIIKQMFPLDADTVSKVVKMQVTSDRIRELLEQFIGKPARDNDHDSVQGSESS